MFLFLVFVIKITDEYVTNSTDTVYYFGSSAINVVLPSYIKNINDYAGKYAYSLESVVFVPDTSLISISKYAFANCVSLKAIECAKCSNLRIIDDFAFYNTSLETITLPEHVYYLGNSAFAYTFILYIQFPDELQYIGDRCFYSSQIRIPEIHSSSKLLSIGDYSFSSTNVEHITLPSTVKHIGVGVFAQSNLKSISFFGTGSKFYSENGCIISRDTSSIIGSYRTNKSFIQIADNINEISNASFMFAKIERCNISSSVKFIKEMAFAYSWLHKITIPKNVVYVDKYAFYMCKNLTSLCIESESTHIAVNIKVRK